MKDERLTYTERCVKKSKYQRVWIEPKSKTRDKEKPPRQPGKKEIPTHSASVTFEYTRVHLVESSLRPSCNG